MRFIISVQIDMKALTSHGHGEFDIEDQIGIEAATHSGIF